MNWFELSFLGVENSKLIFNCFENDESEGKTIENVVTGNSRG